MVRFTTKKIATLTLGEKLKKIRDERRLSLSEISKHTRIQVKYLEYLEEGEYAKLPADVYVKGFLRSYALYLGMSEQSLIKQYEREKGIQKNIKKIDSEQPKKKPESYSSFVITPKIIVVSSIALIIFSAFFYLYKQVNSFVSTPRLVIMKPIDGATVDGKVAHVTGIAEKDAIVTINDQPVLVNEKGEFSEDIGLQGGLNKITVKAKNRFEKETVQAVSVNAQFENAVPVSSQLTTQTNSESDSQQPFELEVYTSPNPTWLSVEADGTVVYSGTMNPNEPKTFSIQGRAIITSSKGNGTFVKLNGKDLGVLGKESGIVKDVEVTSKGKTEK